MEFTNFIDRKDYLERIENALQREKPQFIVIYGRRRIGKSKLVREVMNWKRKDIYFLSDQTNEANQRMLFAKTAALGGIEDFDKVTYPDWETLFRVLNRQVTEKSTVCLDEFPYLVKSCPSLPSVLQKLLNEKCLKFNIIVCGSSQQLMQGYILDRKEPLYGLADEIIRLTPISVRYIGQALGCDARQAIEEYAVWGGIPRYWELRADYKDNETAIEKLLLDNKGFMRDTVQASTLLSIIGNGANRLSEIAGRVGKEATQITEPLGKLRELGYIRREVPFGEDEKKSKKGIYRINDSLLDFNYRFVAPYKSILELGRTETVLNLIKEQFSRYVSNCWEHLCRQYVSGNIIDGITYNMASRWWGKIFTEENKDGEMVELDVVAESLDRKHILIGECKWTNKEDALRLINSLEAKIKYLPFIKRGQSVHTILFLKSEPQNKDAARILYPADIVQEQ